MSDQDKLGYIYRNYTSYEEYVKHQKSKLSRRLHSIPDIMWQSDEDFRNILLSRLLQHPTLNKQQNVLCLAARMGGEVRAFKDIGCTAIGIDLEPGPDNADVIKGDFHNTGYDKDTFDVLYTNSIDHLFSPDKFMRETKRILKPDGIFILEFIDVSKRAMGNHESFWWDSNQAIYDLFDGYQYIAKHSVAFTSPWPGTQVTFVLED